MSPLVIALSIVTTLCALAAVVALAFSTLRRRYLWRNERRIERARAAALPRPLRRPVKVSGGNDDLGNPKPIVRS